MNRPNTFHTQVSIWGPQNRMVDDGRVDFGPLEGTGTIVPHLMHWYSPYITRHLCEIAIHDHLGKIRGNARCTARSFHELSGLRPPQNWLLGMHLSPPSHHKAACFFFNLDTHHVVRVYQDLWNGQSPLWVYKRYEAKCACKYSKRSYHFLAMFDGVGIPSHRPPISHQISAGILKTS